MRIKQDWPLNQLYHTLQKAGGWSAIQKAMIESKA